MRGATRAHCAPSPAWFLLAAIGCGTPESGDVSRPATHILRASDSVLLAETEEAYVANAASLAVDEYTGTFYVSDDFRNRVLAFSRSGEAGASFSGPGSGPGELRRAGSVFDLDSLHILVADYGQGEMEIFEKGSSDFVRSVRTTGYLGFGELATVGDSLIYLPLWNAETGTSVGRWNPATDSVAHVVPMLPYYMESLRGNGRFAMFKAGASLARIGESIVAGMPAEDRLWQVGPDGQVNDTIHVPVRYRRGNPPEVPQLFQTLDRTVRQSVESGSMLRHLSSLSTGELVLVHADHYLEKEPPGEVFTADLYLTIVNLEKGRACVDLVLPNSSIERPLVASRGDTILVLDRRVGDGLGLDTWILFYPLDGEVECDWEPVDAPGEGSSR